MSDGQLYVLIGIAALLIIAMIVGVVLLGVRVYRTARSIRTLTPGGKFAFYGALIYTIFPIDFLPDPIYLDDLGVLGAALLYLTRLAAKQGYPPNAFRGIGPPS